MKKLFLPAVFLIGVAAAAILTLHAGFAGVVQTLNQIGWRGLGAVCAIQLVTLTLCGLAWRAVADDVSFAACTGARWIRDGSSNLVAFIPAIGEVISARALAILGRTGSQAAAASTVVDVAAETLSQALYAAFGFIVLVNRLDPGAARLWLGITLVAILPLFALFALSRHEGALAFAERVGARMAGVLGFKEGTAFSGLAQAVDQLNKQPLRVAASTLLHLAAWPMGAIAVWAAAQGLQHPLRLMDCVILESLAYAARSAAFLVPWGAGVQEGTFVGVGALVAVDATTAIGLSLALRARDLVFGAPSLIFWYLAEGRRFWTRRPQA
ncbi:MAG TPA: lysylphosphatidylglycerol synthase domain-containing protein [Caulobacteraceae bacterium]|nr:lysylphosphatidylglycerol synthase domain-containing protein [Caulobacteraceae bacterium]